MKAEILKLLKESRGFVSGQELCRQFGVSRTAVWKAVNQLKQEGWPIEAVHSQGYRLLGEADVMTASELAAVLETEWVGKRLAYFDETDSTNVQARRLAEAGAPHGTLVAADCQTAGKGRRGRSWSSPKGEGIWMSLLLRPAFAPACASMLTLVAGMAAVRGIERACGLHPLIKWPNDLVLNGKKICGILTEMSTEDEMIRYVVIGMGINVNNTEFPEELKGTAASLRMELGREVRRSPIIAETARAFEEYFGIFSRTRDMAGLREAYDSLLVNRDRQVCVLDPRGEYRGRALGIDDQGSLLVEREDGQVSRVISGEVSVRGIYGYV